MAQFAAPMPPEKDTKPPVNTTPPAKPKFKQVVKDSMASQKESTDSKLKKRNVALQAAKKAMSGGLTGRQQKRVDRVEKRMKSSESSQTDRNNIIY